MSASKYVIIGDGIAGASAAGELREQDSSADIVVLTDEDRPLYNRILLKTYLKGDIPRDVVGVHDASWYADRDIDLRLSCPATGVDPDGKTVTTPDGTIPYDALLVATGGSPRQLPCDDGYDNVRYLWTLQDTDRMKQAAETAERAVVVGGGLLGIDLAVGFAAHGVETDYLIRADRWWARGLDAEGGRIIHDKLVGKGVTVHTGVTVADIAASGGAATAVRTDAGERIPCDVVAAAIGQTPNAGFIDAEKTDRGMIAVDDRLRTSLPDVYAAGNMVTFHHPVYDARVSKGSWDNSEAMGRTAARNMAGGDEPFDYISTYGVGHFSERFQAVGHWTDDAISQVYNDGGYRRLFFDGDRLVGKVAIGRAGCDRAQELIADRATFDDPRRLLQDTFWD